MKKSVLLLGSELGKGGAERSISLLSYYLEKRAGYRVTLALLSGRDRERFYKTCDRVEFIDPPEAAGVWGKIQAWRYRLRRVRELKKSTDADICISFLEGPDYVNILTRGSEKVVLSIRGSKAHDQEIAGLKGKFRKRVLIPTLYRKADQIVTVTRALADELRDHFNIRPAQLTTIYNFYEVETIRQASLEPLSAAEAALFAHPVIVAAGRLHMAKEFGQLLRVFARVLPHEPNARLVILGDGPLREPLLALAAELGVSAADWHAGPPANAASATFHLLGFQANAFKFYARSRVFALSSSWEGFPNVLAEALICGRPVVTTDCHTGPREILDVVDQLSQTPTTTPLRTPVGSLLPLLDAPSEEALAHWTAEIQHWLHAPTPSRAVLDTLTNRFTLDAMLSEWARVIEER